KSRERDFCRALWRTRTVLSKEGHRPAPSYSRLAVSAQLLGNHKRSQLGVARSQLRPCGVRDGEGGERGRRELGLQAPAGSTRRREDERELLQAGVVAEDEHGG